MITQVLALCGAILVSAPGQAGQGHDHFVHGDSVVVQGATVSTWARVNGAGKVTWVGVTMPASLADQLPPPGSGPAGAFAVLSFPPIVRNTTYFNHVELGANPHGHATNPAFAQPGRYSAAHFDIHYYAVPVAQVFSIPPGLFFTPAPANLLPAGWAQPEPFSVPQMGRHAGLLTEFTATDHWLATMVAGFLPNASSMHFIEPMITQELLVSRKNFTLPVPVPASLGWSTRYPSEFVAQYNHKKDTYDFIFKGFGQMH